MSVLVMPNSLDGIGKKATNITAILILMGIVVGFLDVRHAKSADFKALKTSFQAKHIQLIEDNISDIEDEIDIIQSEDALTNRDKTKVSKLRNRKAKYLRRLGDVKASPR